MKKVSLFILLVSVIAACSSKKQSKTSAPIILEIGEHKVPTEEFRYIYAKNNSKSGEAFSEKSLNEYMELFINFKLKVLEAERLQLDTVPSFQKELSGYEKQLAKPYLNENSVTETLVKEAYERMKYEVSAAHILVKVDEEASPSDSLAAYNKILDIRKKIVAGANFGEMAIKHSDDPSAQGVNGMKGNEGDLGYFTAFSMVYPFECAAYNTKVGDVSQPIRTQFGYHILKIKDKRESKGEVRAAHIMIKAANGIDAKDSLAAYSKIKEIHERLVKGASWEELCEQFSEHEPTKTHGGELQAFKLGGRLGAPEFEEAAFALSSPGDLSAPVKSSYGWHVIKLLEKINLKPYEELKAEIERKVKRDSRSNLNYRALIERLKVEDKFEEYPAVKIAAIAKVDSTYLKGSWDFSKEDPLAKKTLFSINGNKYSVATFYEYLKNKGKAGSKGTDVKYEVTKLYDTYVDESIYSYEEVHLVDKYLDYKMLTKEYRDGILLFQLMDEKIWSRAAKDTVGLKAFYEANIGKYQWKDRVKAKIYLLDDASKMASLKKDVEAGLTNDELTAKYNKESALMLKIEEGTFEKGNKELLNTIKWQQGIQTLNDNKGIVNVTEVLTARPKEISEVRGLVISDYQNHLEKEWIIGLKKQKEIKVNQGELKKLEK